MALPINIDALLNGTAVEWERVEFKEGWNPEEVVQALSAFANDFHNWGGGYLVLGVKTQDGKPVLPPEGLQPEQADAWQRKLLELGHKLRPNYHPVTEVATVSGKLVLVVWIPAGEMRPYEAPASLAKDEKRWVPYIRLHANTVEAKGDLKNELQSLANRIPFDDRQNTAASTADLQPTLIQNFLSEVKSDLAADAGRLPIDEVGRRMQIVRGPNEAPRPLNVGLLFFTSDPTRWFPQTQIDVVHLPQGRGGDQIVEKVFKGPIGAMLRDALGYLRNQVVTQFTRKVPEQAEAERYWNVPYSALEEALVNAVYHRSYEEREPIEVQITPEEVTILSFPGPDRTVSMDDLRAGRGVARRYRNRRIGEFLKELELSEGRGTGIPKILESMRANGSPEPQFETDEHRTSFLVRLPLRLAPKVEPTVSNSASTSTGATLGAEKVAPKVEPKVVGRLTASTVSTILTACLEAKRPSELHQILGVKDRMVLLYGYLTPLIEQKWLTRTQPLSPNSPTQRYAVTDAGKVWLAAHAKSAK
ncbi:MAG: putative DNA binding domain-containing protein [Verrucomicrobia bacterium]|nr:putative DNA binding domain-containing protein [Verrucomicrobiota bacterium]